MKKKKISIKFICNYCFNIGLNSYYYFNVSKKNSTLLNKVLIKYCKKCKKHQEHLYKKFIKK